jgi:hypothetical protein
MYVISKKKLSYRGCFVEIYEIAHLIEHETFDRHSALHATEQAIQIFKKSSQKLNFNALF